MLPDFPEAKQKVAQRLLRAVDAKRAETIHVFDQSPQFILHEGQLLVIVREDGVVTEVEMNHLSVEFSIPDDEFERISPEALSAKIESAAIEMGRKQLERVYQHIDETVTNRVSTEGQPVGPEHLLQCFETIQVDFDAKGNPKFPTIVMHPSQSEVYQKAANEIESTPHLRQRLENAIAQKREEWRARESNRKLVG
jgi:hypothetical protein